MSKIIGVTVGTPLSASTIREKIKPVMSVNGVVADENGNVEVNSVTSWNDLTDKPFYQDAIDIFPERTITIGETESATTLRPSVELSIDKNYVVVWNGVEYSCSPFKTDNFGAEDAVFLGNPGGLGGEDNGMPFIIASSVSFDNTMVFADSGNHTLQIIEGSGFIQPIHPKFLPGEVPVVKTATVGQTIAVKAVDENGKPTEWEAVDMPSAINGKDGKDGQDGYTPVKGTDYWTDDDKRDIVNDVLNALPMWEGGSF